MIDDHTRKILEKDKWDEDEKFTVFSDFFSWILKKPRDKEKMTDEEIGYAAEGIFNFLMDDDAARLRIMMTKTFI